MLSSSDRSPQLPTPEPAELAFAATALVASAVAALHAGWLWRYLSESVAAPLAVLAVGLALLLAAVRLSRSPSWRNRDRS